MLSLDRQNALREQWRQTHSGWRPATEVYADLVRAHLKPEARVLDVGCGRGGLVEQLAHPLNRVIGVDPDWISLQAHRLEIPRAAAISHALPFASHSFDLIFASWVLEHLAHPQADLAEIARVLKPGGVFVFITPNRQHPLVWLNRWLARFARLQDKVVEKLYGRAAADTFPAFYRANTLFDLRTLSQQNGLSLTTLHAIVDPTYLAFTPALFRFMAWFEGRLPAARHIHLVGLLTRL